MNVLVTGMKASGKSYLYEKMQEKQPFIMYDTFVIDGELFSNYNDKGEYQVDMVLTHVVNHVIAKNTIVFGAVIIANMIDFDKVIYLRPSFNEWKQKIKGRIAGGRVNSPKSRESDAEIAEFDFKHFKEKMANNINRIVNKDKVDYMTSYGNDAYDFLLGLMTSKDK